METQKGKETRLTSQLQELTRVKTNIQLGTRIFVDLHENGNPLRVLHKHTVH